MKNTFSPLGRHLGLVGLALAVSLPALQAQALPTPVFSRNATVHDPSVVRDGSTFYVFGSHMASASSTDLMNWTQISTSAAAPNPLIRNGTPRVEFAATLAYAGNTDTFWAPDVIKLGDGKYYYYYCACQGSSPLSALGLAKADAVTGPYSDVGIMLKSAGPSPTVSPYNVNTMPNVVDPSVFFDHTGKLWMVYGSFSGGIFILPLDSTVGSPTIGQPLPNQGYGKKLIGGNSSRIEGAYIIYAPETDYYYLFMTFGGLDAVGGYNIRVGRSRNPDGPYLDAAGNDLANVKGNFAFDDATIAPYGVKLMGNWQFLHVAGEPQPTSRGYVSPGGCSVYRDADTGKYLLVFHTRFVGRGEQHEVRVHQLFLNEQGWFVAAPQRYAQETIAKITARQVPGDFKLINHGKAISSTVNTSSLITLNADNTISGAITGTWQLTGDYYVSLALSGVIYRGVLVRQWDDDNQVWVLGFTALSDNGTAWWGSKVAAPNAVVAPALTTSPASQTVGAEGAVTLTAAAGGAPAPEFEWQKDGVVVAAATSATLSIGSAAPGDTGLYTVTTSNFAGTATSAPVILGLSSTTKVVGAGREVGSDIFVASNGNTFDQVLLEGGAATVKADYAQNQITRTSFVDLDNDIVQVEFSGPGTLSIVLQESSGPALPVNYNQDVNYMKGHAGLVITGADEHSNVAVFSVGRATAVNQALFKDGVNYDGIADLAFIAITSTNGKFGGVRTANANYFASRGVTGLYAPGVQFVGPVYVGNVTAFDAATPMLLLGGATGDTLINGGDLHQANGKAVQVKGLTQLKFVAGSTSHNVSLPAQTNQARLEQDGVDVTSQIVVNPGP